MTEIVMENDIFINYKIIKVVKFHFILYPNLL